MASGAAKGASGLCSQSFNDALRISVFVDQAAPDIQKYLKEHVSGWQGEKLKMLIMAVFVLDGHREKQKIEALVDNLLLPSSRKNFFQVPFSLTTFP